MAGTSCALIITHNWKGFPKFDHWLEALKAEPDGLHAGPSVAFASQKPAKLRQPADGFFHAWSFLRRRFHCRPGARHLALHFAQPFAGRGRRAAASRMRHSHHPPRNDSIHHEHALKLFACAQLALLGLAAALPCPVEDLDAPTPCLPAQLPADLFKTACRAGGQQLPVQRLHSGGRIGFHGFQRP